MKPSEIDYEDLKWCTEDELYELYGKVVGVIKQKQDNRIELDFGEDD